MAAEGVESRYNRDWLQLGDDRKVRGFDQQSEERRARTYVDFETGNTVSDVGDNVPD
jgi:hypothetical protein